MNLSYVKRCGLQVSCRAFWERVIACRVKDVQEATAQTCQLSDNHDSPAHSKAKLLLAYTTLRQHVGLQGTSFVLMSLRSACTP